MKCRLASWTVLLFCASTLPAAAQRLPFERSFEVSGPVDLEVSTVRGKIDVVAGQAGRVVIRGTVTVRVGWDVPGNAVELAEKLAKAPPIEVSGNTVRLGLPTDAATQRAVTVAFQVRVPARSAVRTASDSGATTISGIAGVVSARTQSAAIDLASLTGAATVTTGSGRIWVDGVHSTLHVRTQSGAVAATFTEYGSADIETGSSAIRLIGVRGATLVASQSGRITIDGSPTREWALTTGSSNIEVTLDGAAAARLDAASRSEVRVRHPAFRGTSEKRKASGTIGPGGPPLRINSRSGQIHILSR